MLPRPDDDSTAPPAPALPAVRIHGVRLHAVRGGEAIARVLDESDAGRGGVVVTPNLDHLRRVQFDPSFAALVAEAELVVADGMPLLWASRLQGTPLPERVAGSDLISTLSAAAARRGKRVFLLGGDPGTAERAAAVLVRNNPDLAVAGCYCPPKGFEEDDEEMARMTAALVEGRPDVVFVALGSPKQEFLIDRIRAVLPRAWWLGVGVSFSFLCGDVRRAPRLLQRAGLEWVHRLYQEPRRLFKRYVMVGLPFGLQLLGGAARRRVTRWLPGHVDEPARSPATPASARRRGPAAALPPEPAEVDDFSAFLPEREEARGVSNGTSPNGAASPAGRAVAVPLSAFRSGPSLPSLGSLQTPQAVRRPLNGHHAAGGSARAASTSSADGGEEDGASLWSGGGAVALADDSGEIVPPGDVAGETSGPAGPAYARSRGFAAPDVGYAVGRPMSAGYAAAASTSEYEPGRGNGSAGDESIPDGYGSPGSGGNSGNGGGFSAHGPTSRSASSPASALQRLRRLRAVVLLGGKVRPGPLEQSIGRSPLDLPLDDDGRTVLGQWLEHARDLADRAGLRRLPVRVTVTAHSPAPTGGPTDAGGDFTVERDLGQYRGTGGVLRDLAQQYDDDDLILVGNAAQVLLDPLPAVATALSNKRAGVAMVSHRDGSPSGLMLVAVRALRQINPVGFVDFKEQALPAIAREEDVRVVTARRPTGLAIRSTADYVAALRHYHRCGGAGAVSAGKRCEIDPLAEEWRASFGVVEPGATVAASAHVHDSVVLRGATVGEGAVIVRSVVCPGRIVKPGSRVVDELVG